MIYFFIRHVVIKNYVAVMEYIICFSYIDFKTRIFFTKIIKLNFVKSVIYIISIDCYRNILLGIGYPRPYYRYLELGY